MRFTLPITLPLPQSLIFTSVLALPTRTAWDNEMANENAQEASWGKAVSEGIDLGLCAGSRH